MTGGPSDLMGLRHPDPPLNSLSLNRKEKGSAMDEQALTDIAARLDRIERLLMRVHPPAADPVERDLVAALGALTGKDWFTASETFAAIEALRRACEATGDPLPLVAQGLDDLGISSARGFGRWLAALPPEVIERAGKTNIGVLWRIQ